MRGRTYPTLPVWTGTRHSITLRPKIELNITGLKKGEEEINVMIPNDILLFLQIGALSSCHQKVFTAQQMGADAESHNQTLYEERV